MTRKPRYVAGPDLDLDNEDFRLPDGRKLTDELAAQIASQTLAQARLRNLIPGGKSLSGDGKHSPRIQFRLPQPLHERAAETAHAEGVSVSNLARRALEEYLHAHAAS